MDFLGWKWRESQVTIVWCMWFGSKLVRVWRMNITSVSKAFLWSEGLSCGMHNLIATWKFFWTTLGFEFRGERRGSWIESRTAISRKKIGGMDNLVHTWVREVDSVSSLVRSFQIRFSAHVSCPGCFWRHSELISSDAVTRLDCWDSLCCGAKRCCLL